MDTENRLMNNSILPLNTKWKEHLAPDLQMRSHSCLPHSPLLLNQLRMNDTDN